MTTPGITGAISSLDEAIASVRAADACDEAPHGFLAVIRVGLVDLRELLTYHERDGI